MALKCYRTIIKVLCSTCVYSKNNGTIIKDCPRCTFIKYNNVTKLLSLTTYIDTHFPDWVWFKVYEKVKNQKKGDLLATYKNWHKTYRKEGLKWIPTGTTREVPTTDQI